MKSKLPRDNKNSFEQSVEGRVLKQTEFKPNYKKVHGLLAIVKNGDHYRIGTGNYIIVEPKFETIKEAETYIEENSIEVSIRAAVCLSNLIKNGK